MLKHIVIIIYPLLSLSLNLHSLKHAEPDRMNGSSFPAPMFLEHLRIRQMWEPPMADPDDNFPSALTIHNSHIT